jgi:hypothetical protein
MNYGNIENIIRVQDFKNAQESAMKSSPWMATATPATFAVASATAQVTLKVDSSFYFWIKKISVKQTGTDIDAALTNITIDTSVATIQNNLGLNMISQFTSQVDFEWLVAANANLIVSFQNGSTTAANTMQATFWGRRIPTAYIALINKQLGTSY